MTRFKAKIVAALVMTVGWSVSATAAEENVVVRDLDVYFIQEGLDLSVYDSVLLDSLGIMDARVIPPPWADEANPKPWKLTDSDANWLRKSYRNSMTEAISGDDGFPVVDEPGEGVLIVDIEIVTLMPYARRDESVTTRGFGEIRVQAALRDGQTSQLLAIFEGPQDVGSEYQQNTRMNNEQSLQELFAYWGGRVRGVLDNAHGAD